MRPPLHVVAGAFSVEVREAQETKGVVVVYTDESARRAMRQLRAEVVQWLLAPAQRELLRSEPNCARTFGQYAAECFQDCDRCIRDVLRVQAGIPIGAAGDVVRSHEALAMLERCALLR